MLKALKIELLKLKHSSLVWIATIIPLISVFLGRGMATFIKERGFIDDLWSVMYISTMPSYTLLVKPILITVIIVCITRVEHSNNGWKQLLALPVEREKVYFSKFLIALLTMGYSVIILIIGLLIGAISLGAKTPISFDAILIKPFMTMISALPIVALQYYLSFKFSNIGIPLVTGIGLTLPAMLISNSERFWIYYPWTYPMAASGMSNIGNKGVIMYEVITLLFISITALGYWEFRNKDIL